MTDSGNFDELLEKGVEAILEAHDLAIRDLFAVIDSASRSLKKKYPELSLGLFIDEDNQKGTVYRLSVMKKKEEEKIANIFVPTSGYPIELGSYDPFGSGFRSSEELPGRVAVLGYFKELFTRPSSPLLSMVAYFVRKK